MFRENLWLRAFGLFKVPMIGWVGARIVELDDRRCVVRIPLKWRTRNHVGSLYIGVLSVGADVAGALMAVDRIRRSGQPVNFLFKDLRAEYLKRAEGDTLFTCEDGERIADMVAETLRTGERVNGTVRVVATVPDKLGDEPVATFDVTLSLKHKRRG